SSAEWKIKHASRDFARRSCARMPWAMVCSSARSRYWPCAGETLILMQDGSSVGPGRLRSGSRPHRRCWTAGPEFGERWSSRLVATTTEDRLTRQDVIELYGRVSCGALAPDPATARLLRQIFQFSSLVSGTRPRALP